MFTAAALSATNPFNMLPSVIPQPHFGESFIKSQLSHAFGSRPSLGIRDFCSFEAGRGVGPGDRDDVAAQPGSKAATRVCRSVEVGMSELMADYPGW